MKKIVVLVCSMVLSMAVSAQSPVSDTASGAQEGANKQQRFDQVKQQTMARINERLTKLQQRQSCVQAAKNFEALRLCRPERFAPLADQ